MSECPRIKKFCVPFSFFIVPSLNDKFHYNSNQNRQIKQVFLQKKPLDKAENSRLKRCAKSVYFI